MMRRVSAFIIAALLVAPLAYPHGKAVSLAQISDILKEYKGATRLKPAEVKVNKNNPFAIDAGVTKWFNVIDSSDNPLGLIGIENVPTPHGHLAQATCFDKSGKTVLHVIVMRAMEDEMQEIKKLISAEKWWENRTIPKKNRDAWSVLLRSVARTKASIKSHN